MGETRWGEMRSKDSFWQWFRGGADRKEGGMKRWKKYKLFREFGLCEILSQTEAMATSTLQRSGQQVLMFVPFLKNKDYVPIRFIVDGRPAAATMIHQDQFIGIRMLTATERAEWLRISLEDRVAWKAREAAEKEQELASV